MGYRIVKCVIAGIIACSCSMGEAQASKHHLSAPTYYMAISGSLESADSVQIRGATNLPLGANIELYVAEFEGGFGVKNYSSPICVKVDKGGIFNTDLHPKSGSAFHNGGLFAVATLRFDASCKQEASVRKVLGDTGQYLGNDNYDNSFNKTWELTPGMNANPQFVETSHLHFGLLTIARIM